jgi:hypothetical protein
MNYPRVLVAGLAGGIAEILWVAVYGAFAPNFLLVLPLLNPRFLALMPYAATLASKALFGLAMGAVLARGERLA